MKDDQLCLILAALAELHHVYEEVPYCDAQTESEQAVNYIGEETSGDVVCVLELSYGRTTVVSAM